MDAYDKLLTDAEAKEPFYPIELYNAIQTCLSAANHEISSIRIDRLNSLSMNGHLEAEQIRGKFAGGYRAAIGAIRDRISKLAILPS
jgi:hypothetical protein